jgi:hypothetical protein
MSGDAESPAHGDEADTALSTVDGYILIGEEVVILARPWKHGDQSGFTIVKIFAQTSGYVDLDELAGIGELFPEVSSETIAEDLASGRLVQLDSPLPIPIPPPRRTKKERGREARRRSGAVTS